MTYSSQSDVLSWVTIQDGDEYGLRHKCSLKQQLWEVWIAPFISGRILSSSLFPGRNEEWSTSVLSSSLQLAVCLQHLNSLCRVHMKGRGGEQVVEDKLTYPQRLSDLDKRDWKVDYWSGMLLLRDPALTLGQEEGITETSPRHLERGSVFQFCLL